MDVLNNILIILGNCFGVITFACSAALIIHCFYDETIKLSKRKIVVMSAIVFVSVVPMKVLPENIAESTPLILFEIFAPMIIPLIGSGKKFVGYIISFFRIFMTEMLIIIASGKCDIEIMYILGIVERGNEDLGDGLLYDLSITVLPTAICLLLYFFCVRKGIVMPFRRIEKLLVFIYSITLIISMSNLVEGEVEMMRSMLDVFSLVITIITPIFIYKNRQSAYFSELSAHNESFLEAELAASRQYREAQEETRAFRHDIKNELMMLSALMQDKRFEDAESSLNEMLGKVSELSPRIVTGDDMLDSLISSKLTDLDEKGIDVTVKGVLDGGLDWKPIDICSVFANAIDNASESCEKLDDESDKYIRINFRKTDMQRIITISNPTADAVDINALNNGTFRTSKKDKEHHGFGVRNIRKTVEKYGGMLTFSCADNEFVMTVVLMK